MIWQKSTMGKSRRCNLGFTLVELVLCVLVIAIVAALVVPSLGNTAQTRLKGAARMLVADIALARNASISHNTGDPDDRRLIMFDADNDRRYYVATKAQPNKPITRGAGRRDYEVIFGQGRAATLEGVTIDSSSALTFGIYGQLDRAEPATITLACQGQTLAITVDPDTGEATIDG